jgi:hypothetical protein
MTHNLDLFLGGIALEVFKLADHLYVLWLRVTGRYTPEQRIKRMFSDKLPAGTQMWLIIAHLLTKLGVHPHDSKGIHLAGAFQPKQLTIYTADPYGLQWIAFLRHLTTMEDVFDGLVWMKATTHEELEQALGLEEYVAMLPMTVPEALEYLRPQFEKEDEK